MKQWYHLSIILSMMVGVLCTSGILSLVLLVLQGLFFVDYVIAILKNGDVMDSYLHRWLQEKPKKPKNRRKGI